MRRILPQLNLNGILKPLPRRDPGVGSRQHGWARSLNRGSGTRAMPPTRPFRASGLLLVGAAASRPARGVAQFPHPALTSITRHDPMIPDASLCAFWRSEGCRRLWERASGTQ
jgi:hypothetical protein